MCLLVLYMIIMTSHYIPRIIYYLDIFDFSCMSAALNQLTPFSFLGHFLKLDIPEVSISNPVSCLHSPVLHGTSKECNFRMWYQVLGESPGIITVYKSVFTSFYKIFRPLSTLSSEPHIVIF